MTPALAAQRCWTHAEREAVARCVSCRRFFCRECATEHDGRLLCVSCLAAERASVQSAPRTRWAAWSAAAVAGLAAAFLLFYSLGYILEQLPPHWSRPEAEVDAR
jgi:hypothetical protein